MFCFLSLLTFWSPEFDKILWSIATLTVPAEHALSVSVSWGLRRSLPWKLQYISSRSRRHLKWVLYFIFFKALLWHCHRMINGWLTLFFLMFCRFQTKAADRVAAGDQYQRLSICGIKSQVTALTVHIAWFVWVLKRVWKSLCQWLFKFV